MIQNVSNVSYLIGKRKTLLEWHQWQRRLSSSLRCCNGIRSAIGSPCLTCRTIFPRQKIIPLYDNGENIDSLIPPGRYISWHTYCFYQDENSCQVRVRVSKMQRWSINTYTNVPALSAGAFALSQLRYKVVIFKHEQSIQLEKKIITICVYIYMLMYTKKYICIAYLRVSRYNTIYYAGAD